MPEITRTTIDIIQGAFKLIGVFSEDRALSGKRADEGLYYINILLDDFANSSIRIAYNALLNFNLVQNQQAYEISNKSGADVSNNPLVALKYVNLTDGDIQYEVEIIPDNLYYENTKLNTLTGRPLRIFLQNDIDESNLFFVIKPDKAYPCTVKGKFVLNHVTLHQVLNDVPAYYHLFLEYALGRLLHSRYPGSTWDKAAEDTYQDRLKRITAANDQDLTIATNGMFLGNRTRSSNILSI